MVRTVADFLLDRQARCLASAVLRGDPEAQRIVRESLRKTLEELLPPRQRERP